MRLTISVVFLFGFIGFVMPNSVPETISNSLERLDHPSVSIVGGTAALPGDFPFMASVLFPINSTATRLCGGTLIASSYILTAAQCVFGLPSNATSGFVFINSLNLTGGGAGSIARRVSSYIRHPQYFFNSTNTAMNDIALLVLDQPVTNISFVKLPTDPTANSTTTTLKPTTTTTTLKPTTTTTTVKPTTTTTTVKPTTTTTTTTTTTPKPTSTTTKPIGTATTRAPVCSCTCSPSVVVPTKPAARRLSRAFSTYTNSSAMIAGWGVTSSGGISLKLQKASVTVYDNSICKSQWKNQFDATNQLCAAQTNAAATCFGDSGGPILVGGNIQVGITSFGVNPCVDPNHVPVFTRVSAYVDWIASTMASNPPPAAGK